MRNGREHRLCGHQNTFDIANKNSVLAAFLFNTFGRQLEQRSASNNGFLFVHLIQQFVKLLRQAFEFSSRVFVLSTTLFDGSFECTQLMFKGRQLFGDGIAISNGSFSSYLLSFVLGSSQLSLAFLNFVDDLYEKCCYHLILTVSLG